MGVQAGNRKDSSLPCQREEAIPRPGLEEWPDLKGKSVGAAKR